MNLLIILGIVVILAIIIASMYNSLVKLRNNRENAFADIDVQLKQRHDLIPQLVDTVKGYAGSRKGHTWTRHSGSQRSLSVPEQSMKRLQQRINLVPPSRDWKSPWKAYPDLKANQNFLQLQEEISDVENKLAAVRRYFNSATKELNNAVQTFPSNLIANMFGFHKEMMFDLGTEQRANLEEAPKIKF